MRPLFKERSHNVHVYNDYDHNQKAYNYKEANNISNKYYTSKFKYILKTSN